MSTSCLSCVNACIEEERCDVPFSLKPNSKYNFKSINIQKDSDKSTPRYHRSIASFLTHRPKREISPSCWSNLAYYESLGSAFFVAVPVHISLSFFVPRNVGGNRLAY